MKSTVVINIVGLSKKLIGPHTPHLVEFIRKGTLKAVKPVFPALTCSSQSTYVTGLLPSQHGVVGNGWYFPDLAQVWFWRQSNSLVQGEKIWETAKKKNAQFTCANLFWWFNMYSSADYSVTPRPVYRADGLKLPDIYSEPDQLRDELQSQLGDFPLFQFWGPNANSLSSQWIARASRHVFQLKRPTLSLVYLPHLDYCLQKEGPDGSGVPQELKKIDAIVGELIDFFESEGVQVILLSEYGINPVRQSIQVNRRLREVNLLRVRVEKGEDHFDAGASDAFAVADHQIAHIYVKNKSDLKKVKQLLETLEGVDQVIDKAEQKVHGIDHFRSGDLVAVSKMDYWFSYAYWLDDRRAPDYARTVDIHRKPGYDPAELFLDPEIKFPKFRIAKRLIAKKLGFRYLMDVIPLKDFMVKGSHGRADVPEEYWPVFATTREDLLSAGQNPIEPTGVKDVILNHIFN